MPAAFLVFYAHFVKQFWRNAVKRGQEGYL